MLPTLRKRLKTISDGNKGLQDILRSMQEGTEILSVEPYNGKVHNTKITLLLKGGEKRVHFYNRLSLKKILEAYPAVVGNTIDEVIENLNLLGFDFTTDDIDLVSGSIVAKPTSLGYYNDILNNTPNECTNVVDLNWYNKGEEHPGREFQNWVVNLNPPLVKVGQKWNLSFNGTRGSLLYSGNYASNSLYYRNIEPWEAEPETGWTKIVNYEPEHFQFKFIYVFKDNRIYDWNTESWVNEFTKSGSFRKLLLGPHQTNNSVTVDSYPLEQLWVRYPELQSGDYLEAVQSSIFGQDFDEVFPQYEPIPEQDALVIEINILYCPNPNCNPTSLSMQRFNSTIPETHQNGALTIQLIKNGSTITEIIRPSQVQLQGMAITIINMIRWFVEGQGITIADGGGGFGQYRVYDRSISGGSTNSDPGPVEGPILPGNNTLNPSTIRIIKTQGEPVETDIFEWLLEAEEGLDAETLTEVRSLGLSIRSCGAQYWEGL